MSDSIRRPKDLVNMMMLLSSIVPARMYLSFFSADHPLNLDLILTKYKLGKGKQNSKKSDSRSLVVYLPLWQMMEFVSWDDDTPNIWKNNPNVPNHQAVII